MMKRLVWGAVVGLFGGLLVCGTIVWLGEAARAAKGAVSTAVVRDVVINEVAWMGTGASSYDEWVELYNTTDSPIDIATWSVYGADTGVCINFSDVDGFVTTTIPAHGYLIYANGEDNVKNATQTSIVDIWDPTIGMNNSSPGQIVIYDAPDCGGNMIDTVNQPTGDWFAGDSATRQTMERKHPTTLGTDEANWCSNDPDIARNGLDAAGNPITGTPKAQNSCYQPPADPKADLAIAKRGPRQVVPGDLITYHISLSNTGAVTATAVRVTDTLPTAVISITTTPSAYLKSSNLLVWEIGDVAIGTHHLITFTGYVTETAIGLFTNYVTATTAASETTTTNNYAMWDTTAFIPGQSDLVVTKTGPAMTTPGSPIVYYIGLGNTGAITATDVRLTDTLPPGIISVTGTPSASLEPRGALVWDLGDVVTGGHRTLTVTGQVAGTVAFTLTNRVTATTTANEERLDNNHAAWTTAVDTQHRIYLSLVLRNYTPPRYGVIIEAVLYDGWQTDDYDEAVLLFNGDDRDVPLAGWELCKMRASDWDCDNLPTFTIKSRQRLWLARSETYFEASFGFAPDHALVGWPEFANLGDEVALRDTDGAVRDVLVYEAGYTGVEGWDGAAVEPHDSFAEAGQILYRIPDEADGQPLADTDTAADWAQYTADPWQSRRVRYPGWDLEPFFQPALGATGTVTVGIAPDNAYRVVVDTIRSAEERLDLALYSLEHHDLVGELVQQAQQGVSVTVLLEGGPVGGVADQELWACEQLHATERGRCYFMVNASDHKVYDRYNYMHAKFIVVDRERLLVGSQNLTLLSLPGDDKGNGTGGSRGVVLVTDAPEVVARAVEIFQADCDPDHHADVSMWGPGNLLGYAAPPPGFTADTGGDWTTYTVQFSQTLVTTGTGFEMVTAPETALRTGDGLLGLVARAGAGDGVYVEQLYEHADWGGDPASVPNLRLASYIAAARRGATVRILLNGGNFGIEHISLAKNIETAAYVNQVAQAEGLDISAHLGDPTQYGIHNKMVLVDLGAEGRYAHVGSINGSETSNKVNREMALQVRSDALFDYLFTMFDYDWHHKPPEGHLVISEVLYDPAGIDTGQEWVEIYNPTTEHVGLSGWYLGDVGPSGEYGSGLYRFPPGANLLAEDVIVVAHQAADVSFTPDYEFLIDAQRDDPSVPNMVPAGFWDGFGFALGNIGDEVLLLDTAATAVDVVTYGAGHYPGVIPHPGVDDQGHSLERRPPRQDTEDCSQDFFDRNPPTPGALPE